MTTRRASKAFFLVALAAGSAACSFHARGPEDYRDDTAALLESKNPDIKACYDDVLKKDPTAKGAVAVKFKVTEDTGAIRDVSVDPGRTTAPQPVAECVVRGIDGLVLTPPDAREGHATFVYDFTAAPSPAPAAPAPPAPAADKPAS